jgi:hypothetical protein
MARRPLRENFTASLMIGTQERRISTLQNCWSARWVNRRHAESQTR